MYTWISDTTYRDPTMKFDPIVPIFCVLVKYTPRKNKIMLRMLWGYNPGYTAPSNFDLFTWVSFSSLELSLVFSAQEADRGRRGKEEHNRRNQTTCNMK